MAEARERRITTLNLDRKIYMVLVTPAGSREMLVLSETPGDALLSFIGSVDFSWDILQHLLTDPFDAMTIVDDKAKIVYISPIHEAFFGLKAGEGNGRPVETVIDNTRLHEIVATGKAEVGKIQRMRGGDRVVSRIPIKRDGKVLGAIGRVRERPIRYLSRNGRGGVHQVPLALRFRRLLGLQKVHVAHHAAVVADASVLGHEVVDGASASAGP